MNKAARCDKHGTIVHYTCEACEREMMRGVGNTPEPDNTNAAGAGPGDRAGPGRRRGAGAMTDTEIVAAIRANHRKANIAGYEAGVDGAEIHWDRAWIDPGLGGGLYAKVPITLHFTPEQAASWRDFIQSIRAERGMTPEALPEGYGESDEIVVRVYPPARLRRRLTKARADGEGRAP
jgi:hypothetical protein